MQNFAKFCKICHVPITAPTARSKHILIWSDNDNAVRVLTKKDIRNQDSQEIVIKICAMEYGFPFILHISKEMSIYMRMPTNSIVFIIMFFIKYSRKNVVLLPPELRRVCHKQFWADNDKSTIICLKIFKST